ncbi:serine-type D-Ala-D-Ala carboxypeptidase (penicillin-binding protein 5/6) [Frankia sp. AiPs1]|uniref:D-alanyl-D-alanine carboxypeptidase family protein n=1 Tax=Frankia sp. AiPa1 TaxID=573492 RepID=UPI00202AE116|nr:serine hydrolase [Frankia sp. AiPa1]MCL9757736.1 D-alanyl-D-alanine carboxypeptidase [Frankia sp. AiPa1]
MHAARSCHSRPAPSRAARTGRGLRGLLRGRRRRVLALLAAGALITLARTVPAQAAPTPAPAPPAATPQGAADANTAPPANLTAKDWVIADADSGAILAASHLHDQDMPASTMKILTALTILPSLPENQTVTVGEDASRVDGTKVGLVPGIGYSVHDLATAMLISSGNDATVALVDASGGAAAVLHRMGALATSLGARDTVAGDPTGLDSPGQLTSVHDLAVFGRAAIHEPTVRQYLTIRRASLPGRGNQRFEIQNHNLLLARYAGTIGVKNGYTVAAGATFVGAATRGGRTLVVALLRTAPEFDLDARALLDWGFAHDGQITPVGYLPHSAASPAVGPYQDTARPDGAVRPTPRAAALPTPRAGEHGGILTHIGPTTWIAVALTAVACLVTVATGRAGRRARRARQARYAATHTRLAAMSSDRAERAAREPPSRDRRPSGPDHRPGYPPRQHPTLDSRSPGGPGDRRPVPRGDHRPGTPGDPPTAPVRRLPIRPGPAWDGASEYGPPARFGHDPRTAGRHGDGVASGPGPADGHDDGYRHDDGYGHDDREKYPEEFADEGTGELFFETSYKAPRRGRS